VQDGNLITANGPAAATKFAWAIVDFLKILEQEFIPHENIMSDSP